VRSNQLVCFVEHGGVDVFSVAADGDAPTGARHYLFSIGGGQLLAFPSLPPDSAEVVAVVPRPDARCRFVERAQLLSGEAIVLGTLALPAMLDQFTAILGAALHRPPPAGSVSLAPGQRHAAGDAGLALAPDRPGTWVEVDHGCARVAGAALSAGQCMPLHPGSWVLLEPGSRLTSQTSGEFAARAGNEALLDGTERLFLCLFEDALERKRSAEAAELKRLQLKSATRHRLMSDALAGLATLDGAPQPSACGGVGCGLSGDEARLLAACRLVGQPLGIGFRAAPPQASGAGRRDLVQQIAQASNVFTRKVALKGRWWVRDNGPLLAEVAATRAPLALLPSHAGYEAVDPASGERSTLGQELADRLAPHAVAFYAGLPAKKLGLVDILRFMLRGRGRDLMTVAAAGAASALLAMSIPLASGHLFDHVFPAAERQQMIQLVVMLLIAGLVTLLFDATRALATLRIEGKASNDLQAAIWDRVLRLSPSFFRNYPAGDLATRINGINEIRQLLSGTLMTTLVTGIFSMFNVLLLFHYSARLGLVALALLLIAVSVSLTVGYLGARVVRACRDAEGKVAGIVLEYLSGIGKLRATGAESRAFANWAARFAEQKRLAVRAGRIAIGSDVFAAAFPVASSAALFGCMAWMLNAGQGAGLQTGDFIAFTSAWTVLLACALALVRTGVALLGVGAAYQRVKPILETEPEVDPARPQPGPLAGAIELANVSFAYEPNGPLILEDVSFSIAAGEFVALVGTSGSGKSTLLRLMLGFEKPASGGVYYDDHNLEEVDVGAIRRQLGVVMQGGCLMSGNIFSNIVGTTGLSLGDAWEAAAACGLDQDIEAMPMGMHSVVSDGGGTLSGGQRQRVLIARAIVNKPRIVLFDEATSALDNRTQTIVSVSLEQLRATRVVIAHRLSTIINADRILVLDKGKIVQSGTYDELVGRDGLFADLARRQLA
jgi:ATP-binding cassette subfamily C protein